MSRQDFRPNARRAASVFRGRSGIMCMGAWGWSLWHLRRGAWRHHPTGPGIGALKLDGVVTTSKSVEQSPVRSTREALTLADKPSIAALAFTNMSADPEQDSICRWHGRGDRHKFHCLGITWLFVIARNSSFTYKGQSPDVEAGWTRTGCPLRARRVGTQRRQSGPHHGTVDRCTQRRAPLGRSLRRFDRRCLRVAGQGGEWRCRCNRAEAPACRDRAGKTKADRKS